MGNEPARWKPRRFILKNFTGLPKNFHQRRRLRCPPGAAGGGGQPGRAVGPAGGHRGLHPGGVRLCPGERPGHHRPGYPHRAVLRRLPGAGLPHRPGPRRAHYFGGEVGRLPARCDPGRGGAGGTARLCIFQIRRLPGPVFLREGRGKDRRRLSRAGGARMPKRKGEI